MASVSNSRKDFLLSTATTTVDGNNYSFIGDWEDIKDYTSAIITINSIVASPGAGISGRFTVQWAHTAARSIPTNTDVIATENFEYIYNAVGIPLTRQFDHRARWFRLRFEPRHTFAAGVIDFQTLYKRAPTELKIVDDQANVVSVLDGPNGNSLYTLLTDSTGAAIRTTSATTGSALYTHLADRNGVSIATTSETQVAIYNGGGAATTGPGDGDPVYISNFSLSLGTATLTNGLIYYVNGYNVRFSSDGTTLTPRAYNADTNNMTVGQLPAEQGLLAGVPLGVTATTIRDTTNNTDIGITNISFTLSLERSLIVGLRDAQNIPLTTTGPTASNNALYIRPGDSAGNAQASTINVNGAATEGVALFGALSDNLGNQITTTKNRGADEANVNNSLFVHLTSRDGRSISKTNPLPVISTVEIVGSAAFDIPNGVSFDMVTTSDLASVPQVGGVDQQLSLYNLFIYNDYATTAWVKVYDICSGAIAPLTPIGNNDAATNNGLAGSSVAGWTNAGAIARYNATALSTALKYNLTVQPGRARDLAFPGGSTFNNGIYIRVTTAYDKASVAGPDGNSVFISGTYLKETKKV